MNKIYKCECGKEFEKSNNLNAHKSHCLIHLGPEKYYLRNKVQMQKMSKLGNNKKKQDKSERLLIWINEKHVCEKCGKVMTEKYGKGRFCSKSCANSRQRPDQVKHKISESVQQTLLLKPDDEKVMKSNYAMTGFYQNFYCASSYELIFLLYCLDNNIDIKRCPFRFPYYFDNSRRTYFPDFYLPETDTIIELKGRGLYYNKDEVEAKANSVTGHNYKIIYDDEINNFYIPWLCHHYNIKRNNLKDFILLKLNKINEMPESKKHVGRTTGYKWIHNNDLNKSISVNPEKLNDYLNCGWEIGRILYK